MLIFLFQFNGLICLLCVAVLSFVMVGLAYYQMKNLITLWLTASCLMIMFIVSYDFISTAMSRIGFENEFFPYFITIAYGAIGCLVRFLISYETKIYFLGLFH